MLENFGNKKSGEDKMLPEQQQSASDEKAVPDYSSEIELRKLAIKKIERESLDKDDSEAMRLESEIYELERQKKVSETNKKIAAHKEWLDELEEVVKTGNFIKGNAGEESDIEIEIENRERIIHELEDSINFKAPAKIEKEKLDQESTNAIQAVQNFSDLNQVIDKVQQVKGSEGAVFSAEYLKQLIDSVRSNSISLEHITRTYGLRDKVEALLANEVKSEYLQLKKNFKESQSVYLSALERDYADRNLLQKMFGLGRKEFSPAVQGAYDAFMKANQAYYSFAEKNGNYQKIAERISREHSTDKVPNIDLLVANRHVLRPAEARLEQQKVHLPAYLQDIKNGIQDKIKQYPKTALGVGALLTLLNPAAVAAAVGVRYVGNKFYVAGKEYNQEVEKNNVLESIHFDEEAARLDELEAQYYEAARQVQDAKVHTNMAAVGAAVAAGAAYGGGAEEVVLDKETVVLNEASGLVTFPEPIDQIPTSPSDLADVIEVSPVTEGIAEVSSANTFEATRTLEDGDVLSKVILQTLQERMQSGQLTLPEGVNQDRLAHYIYQSFPEMTNASNIEPRLTAAEWKDLGVSSGDPHLIQPGEKINVQGLIEKMWGMSTDASVTPADGQGVVPRGVETHFVPTVEAAPDAIERLINSDTEVVVEQVPTSSTEIGVPVENEAVTAAERTAAIKVKNGDEWLYREPRITVIPDTDAVVRVSERLGSLVTEWQKTENASLHEYLYKTILQGFRTGNITLPAETVALVAKNQTALYGFIEQYMPEVSENALSKFFRGTSTDALSIDQWKTLGIQSGNPHIIAPGEQIQTGEIIKILLDRARTATNV